MTRGSNLFKDISTSIKGSYDVAVEELMTRFENTCRHGRKYEMIVDRFLISHYDTLTSEVFDFSGGGPEKIKLARLNEALAAEDYYVVEEFTTEETDMCCHYTMKIKPQ